MNLVVDCDYYAARRGPTNSFRRRLPEMRLMRGISGRILEHAVDRCRERLRFYDSGKYRAISDFGVDQKSGPLRNLKCVKFFGGRANSFFYCRRLRCLE